MEEEKKKSKTKSIITYVICALCISLCLYIIIAVITAKSNNRPPSVFGLSISHVPTASMEPTINTGDYVLFSSTTFDDVKEGDIIVYRSEVNNIFIIHRVVNKVDNGTLRYLICKGDNNSTNPIADSELIRPDMVCGKFITTLSFMGLFKGGINTNIIFAILAIIFMIMLGMQITAIVMKYKNNKLKEEKEKKRELIREELRKEILAEEIAKIKALKEKQENEDPKE